jgi:hypothetical protein
VCARLTVCELLIGASRWCLGAMSVEMTKNNTSVEDRASYETLSASELKR